MSGVDVVARRLAAQHLDLRLPASSWRRAARSGLQDGAPRSVVLALHARAEGVTPDAWEDPAFAQVWGPRGAVFVVPVEDVAAFTLGLLSRDASVRASAERDADALAAALGADRVRKREALPAVGGRVASLLAASTTGRIRLRWDGRDTLVWVVPAPDVEPETARTELARRFLDAYGPSTADGFARWAGLPPAEVRATWSPGASSPTTDTATPSGVRLLPPGDPFLLSPDRELLVPDDARRRAVWPRGTPQPGALLVDGEFAGTWRRRGHRVDVTPFGPLTRGTRRSAEEEAAGFPLDLAREVEVRWLAG
ncbi:DNA glycosylase AlkZ-like family protein [Actinomycetospora aeridis]|uniref:Crosslink repair DNA glycosylase YcaQ family protein n=1 Tax=Actinomycetospora aeridis TaxID=3129231 RepID=A0ABU8NHL8_9PSEU